MKTLFALLLLLTGCFSHQAYMSRNSYDSFNLGTSVAEVESKVGRPYAVWEKGAGTVEYEYIERLDLGMDNYRENHYILTFSHGQLVSKRVKTQSSPAYDLIYQEDPNYTSY